MAAWLSVPHKKRRARKKPLKKHTDDCTNVRAWVFSTQIPHRGTVWTCVSVQCPTARTAQEIGFFVGGQLPPLGRPLSIQEAEEHIFGRSEHIFLPGVRGFGDEHGEGNCM